MVVITNCLDRQLVCTLKGEKADVLRINGYSRTEPLDEAVIPDIVKDWEDLGYVYIDTVNKPSTKVATDTAATT